MSVGVALTGVPLVTVRLPGVITPVPSVKMPVKLVVPPAVIDVGFAMKLVIAGAATFTVMVTVIDAVTPAELVTVSV